MVGNLILIIASALLAWYAVRPDMSAWRKRATSGAIGALLLISMFDSVSFFGLVALGEIGSGFPLPLSLLVAAALVVVLLAVMRAGGDPVRRRLAWWLAALTVPAVAVLFPLAQMYCFGKTDYRRPADAAVVFGAAVRSNGRPSHALADRVRTGCTLYRDGLVEKLIFSGGPGPGKVDEVDAMKTLAMLLTLPWFLAREVAALWVYYLRPIIE